MEKAQHGLDFFDSLTSGKIPDVLIKRVSFWRMCIHKKKPSC